jgi:O-antigen/teichoic acid export membrane protein
MSNRSFGRNFLVVVFSRIVSLLASVAVGFMLPKILSITDYGFYKVFTLYAVYTALLHFGFVDGILLKLSGKEYKEVDAQRMRTLTRFFVVFELLLSIAILIVGGIIARGEYLFIVIMLALNMVFVNITTYYQFVSQAVQRFGEYSVKNIVISIVKVVFVLVLLTLNICYEAEISYKIYLIGLNILDLLIMVWYIALYHDITFGRGESFRAVKQDIISIFKSGILLTLAYQVSHLILALDRQFVSLLFSTEEFAVYSFAYNIVSMISTMVSAISIVLLPMLKNRSHEVVVQSYRKCLSTVAMISAGSLLCYFPLIFLIKWFLPEYCGSLVYLAIVLPIFLFSSAITVVMFTINKVFEMNFSFFRDGCFILVLGLIFNMIAYWAFRSPQAISCASLCVTMIWFLISGVRLKNKTGVKVNKEFLYLLSITLGFLVITNCFTNIFLGFATYLIWLVFWTIAFHKTEICEVYKTLKEKFGKFIAN